MFQIIKYCNCMEKKITVKWNVLSNIIGEHEELFLFSDNEEIGLS